MSTRLNYIAPWWIYWLHNFPHLNLSFQSVDSSFRPQDEDYQQSLIVLTCMAAIGLGLNLLLLAAYLTCVCCCQKDEDDEESKRPGSRCVSWVSMLAGLVICCAVGVGFYGNSEANDGVYQLTHSLYQANHTLDGIDRLVTGTVSGLEGGLKQHLGRLDEIFAVREDYVRTLHAMQRTADSVVVQLRGLPDLGRAKLNLSTIAEHTLYWEHRRWLAYLLVLVFYLVISLAVFLGLAKQSRWLLTILTVFGLLTLVVSWASLGADTAVAVGTSDFCVSPDKFIVNQTEDIVPAAITHYYLYCSPSLLNPFQKLLTIFQRSLTTMQTQTQSLLLSTALHFPTAQRDLFGIQQILNTSESSLHQLTALLDCRSLHKDYLEAVVGLCYDGVEGLLYLCLFSLMSAGAFCVLLCAIPRLLKHIASREREYDDIDEEDPFNPRARRTVARGRSSSQSHVHSFCSYSSRESQSSLHLPPPLPTTTNAPIAEYMNQSMLFGGNPRYENVPLIGSGRSSPPPSYSPSLRSTYLSMTDSQIRHFGTDLPV
uniref:Protein tweety homolog n=2 Tax=Paramormyrops kingsleyae TaxID=1676925 RepID=A0A3B3TCF1_9TELE|nr:protein tweety homolog 2-like isoform X1 [Paramormyrops kingsleyae]